MATIKKKKRKCRKYKERGEGYKRKWRKTKRKLRKISSKLNLSECCSFEMFGRVFIGPRVWKIWKTYSGKLVNKLQVCRSSLCPLLEHHRRVARPPFIVRQRGGWSLPRCVKFGPLSDVCWRCTGWSPDCFLLAFSSCNGWRSSCGTDWPYFCTFSPLFDQSFVYRFGLHELFFKFFV